MKFGVCLPTFRYGAEPTTEHIFSIVRAAEQAGYDSVWAGDHVLVPADQTRMRFFADPLVTLSVVAGMSHTLELGTSVVIAPLRNPFVLAKEAATLDFLSGGRLILGLGAGWLEPEFDYLNADFKERGRLFDETLQILRAVWGAVPASFTGDYYQVEEAVLEPQPARPGGPPIWIGGGSCAALRRTARFGNAWHADDTPADDIAVIREQLSELLAETGRTAEVTTRVTTKIRGLNDSEEERKERGEGYYRDADAWSGVEGSADELYDQVCEFADAGSTHYIAQFEHTTVEDHIAALEAFADNVISKFHS